MRFLCWGDVGLDAYQDEPDPRPGGCALNVACSLVRAGAEGVAVAAPLGSDGFSLRALLAARGVDVGLLAELEGPSPRQRIRLDPSGEREFCGYEGGVLTGFQPGAQLRAAIEGAGLVYVPVFDLTLSWARLAWELRAGKPLALDLMDLSDVDVPFVEEAVARSSLVFCGLDSERHQDWIQRLRRWAARPGAALVVVTLGAEGALAFEGQEECAVPAALVPGGVVDTTGCGDAFAGTFLAARAAGCALPAALARGAARGAEVAAQRGAVET